MAMAADETVPPGIDISTPSIARVYDFMVGGQDNFAVDRMAAQRALEIMPDAPEAGRACRAFLRRTVRYLAAGLPTQTNVHQVAHDVDPAARVLYVDNDPMVLVHGHALLQGDDTSTIIEADLRSPETILAAAAATLDFSRPVGLLLFSVLHHLHDDEHPHEIAATLRDALPAGSHLAIIHFWDPADERPEISAKVHQAERVFNETLGTGRWRQREEIQAFFGDFVMVDPGLVPLAEWRPGDEAPAEQKDTYYTVLGGVAAKSG
jgi:hypothetical protein